MPPNESKSLGRLAQRILAWTTNSVITVMLVVVAFVFGREVLHWWRDGGELPAGEPGMAASALGDGAAPHVLEFGDQAWSIRRQDFSGRRSGVSAAFQSACRAAIVDCRPLGESADSVEQELLKRLAGERPVAEEHGQWRIYQWGDDHPVLIGTRAFRGSNVDANQSVVSVKGATAPGARTNLDETPYRVVIWGVAIPAAANAWALYLFQSGGAAGGQSRPEVEIPLPPTGHRLMSMWAADCGAITAFSADDGDAARGFYDRWFADHGWKAAHGWQQVASGWHARFAIQSRPDLAVDIRLGSDSQSRWTGLVMENQVERGKR
ncbi:MAG: hypothetical protein ACLP9L_23435 [Thermoguttaceae bacterium]